MKGDIGQSQTWRASHVLAQKRGGQSQEFTIDRLSPFFFFECFNFAFLGSGISVTPGSRQLTVIPRRHGKYVDLANQALGYCAILLCLEKPVASRNSRDLGGSTARMRGPGPTKAHGFHRLSYASCIHTYAVRVLIMVSGEKAFEIPDCFVHAPLHQSTRPLHGR